MNTLCKGFDYRARYAAPETHGAPIVYRSGNVPFPPLAFWRCRYGFLGKISPQWAEYLSLDFQPLSGYADSIVTRILDYLYESPCGGSAAEREAVLSELAQCVDVAAHFRLRANAEWSDGRSWRCHFFQRVNITDPRFWQRLALVYASLAPTPLATLAGETEQPWCHALLEEARFWQAPICTPQWIETLSVAPVVGIGEPPVAPLPAIVTGPTESADSAMSAQTEIVRPLAMASQSLNADAGDPPNLPSTTPTAPAKCAVAKRFKERSIPTNPQRISHRFLRQLSFDPQRIHKRSKRLLPRLLKGPWDARASPALAPFRLTALRGNWIATIKNPRWRQLKIPSRSRDDFPGAGRDPPQV